MQKKITHSLGLIEEAIGKYHGIAVASSFGKDSIVTIHLCRRVDPSIQVFTVMTPFKLRETREYMEKIVQLWNLNIKQYGKVLETEEIYKTDVERCCDYYKVEPFKRAIKELKLTAWISGLRGTEGHTRKFLNEVEERGGLIKINPILQWTEAEIWLYHAAHNIPVHPLYTQGYRSLGCAPCSKPYTDTERGGRWQNTPKAGGECGIHTRLLKDTN